MKLSDNITLSDNLEDLVASFEKELKHVMDTLAPVKNCTMSLRAKRPWYDDELRSLKRTLRKHERKWLKYKLQSNWTAFTKLRNKYTYLLKKKKINSICNKITTCSNDTCQLYRLISNLTSRDTKPQWPKHDSKQQLADGFANYFKDKILLIREKFRDIAEYYPPTSQASKLAKFAPLTSQDILKTINQLKTKSCELETMPTHIFKQIALTITGLITKIVNLSLENGEFYRSWKVAVVRPLLKKLGLELINPNFRPISNLPFLSKS